MGSVNLSKVTVNLSKGDVVNLSKQSDGLKKVMIALGWDEAKGKEIIRDRVIQPGFIGKIFGAQPKVVTERIVEKTNETYDLDAWIAFMKNGNVKDLDDVVYYGKKDAFSSNCNYAHHCGDNLTGAGDGDDEQIIIDLENIPDKYNGIVVGVTIYKGKEKKQSFGDIENLFVRVVDTKDDFEICRYEDSISSEYKDCTTFIVGKLYKDKGEWNFKSAGYGTKDGTIFEATKNYKG